jgi:phosphoribosylformylglycinamidine synthase
MAFLNNFGFDIKSVSKLRIDSFLFGESQSRAVLTVSNENENEFLTCIKNCNLSYQLLGEVKIDESIYIDGINFGTISTYSNLYQNTIPNLMNS